MSPIETQIMAEVLFWFVIFILAILACEWVSGKVIDRLTLTPEEQDQREKENA